MKYNRMNNAVGMKSYSDSFLGQFGLKGQYYYNGVNGKSMKGQEHVHNNSHNANTSSNANNQAVQHCPEHNRVKSINNKITIIKQVNNNSTSNNFNSNNNNNHNNIKDNLNVKNSPYNLYHNKTHNHSLYNNKQKQAYNSNPKRKQQHLMRQIDKRIRQNSSGLSNNSKKNNMRRINSDIYVHSNTITEMCENMKGNTNNKNGKVSSLNKSNKNDGNKKSNTHVQLQSQNQQKKNKNQMKGYYYPYSHGQNSNKNGATLSERKNMGHSYSHSNHFHYENNVERNKINKQIKQSKQIKRNKTSDKLHNANISIKMAQNDKFIPYNKEQQNKQQNKDNRLNFNYSYRTRKGRHINNPNKINQDSILVKQNIGKRDLHMIAVADGHGQQGHHVSQFVIKMLSKSVSEEVGKILEDKQKSKSKVNSDKKGQSNQIQNQKISQQQCLQLSSILPKVYDKIQNQLTCSQVNSATSGSTLVNVILQRNQILCANVGDSRAILARQVDKKNWQLIYLSQDHKPENQVEKRRVLKSGGHVHAFKGVNGQSLGPLRVWLPNQNIQGLAMTRSFGDNISKTVGVTHKPQMIKVPLTVNDKFILVASDGVWEFIKNQQILQLIVPFYKQNKLQQACDQLLKLAYQRWTKDDNSVVDDISFVLVFFSR